MIAAFAGAYMLAPVVLGHYRKRRSAIVAQGYEPSATAFLAWRLRNGVPALEPLASLLLRSGRIVRLADDYVDWCKGVNLETTPSYVLSTFLALLLAVGVVVGVLVRSPIAAFAVPLCLAVASSVLVESAKDRRREAVRESVPAALESMTMCFGSGFTLLQTFRQVANDVQGPLGASFGRGAHVLEMGGGASQALAELKDGVHSAELAFVVVALDVQHESGGAIRPVLEAAKDTVKGELSLQRSLRVQTAQAKLSARIVVVMPFLLIAAFSLASPDFLAPFFSSVFGYALLGLAVLMQVAGIFLVRRALSVGGVT